MASNEAAKRIVIIGGTSAIAEHCARRWVGEGAVRMTLVVRDPMKADRVAADLRVRAPSAVVDVVAIDFADPVAIRSLSGSLAALTPIDIVLIAHGSLPDQATCEADLVACRDALEINAVSPALFAEAFAAGMQRAGRGHLIIIGSVAGDRGRKSNYTYGAAKGLLDRYAQGLQHRFAMTGVRVTLVKPGPTDTPMTATMKAEGGRLATPDEVARLIVDGAARGKPVVYAPGKWALIMFVIRNLPRAVFARMDI